MFFRVFFNKKFLANFFVSASIAFLIIFFKPDILKSFIVDDKFILNFLLTILILSVAIFTLLFSTVDKIREEITKIDEWEQEKVSEVESNIKGILQELKDDIFLIFYSLIILFILIFIRGIDPTEFPWPEIVPISKLGLYTIIKFAIFVPNIFALYDIIHSLFNLVEASSELSQYTD